MTQRTHIHPSDLRGLSRLTIDATAGVTHLVEAVHRTVSRAPGVLGAPVPGRAPGIAGLVYRSIRGVTSLVGGTLDAVLAPLVPLLGERESSPEREAWLAVLNGVVGDHLDETGNPLAIPMRWRHAGQPLEPQAPPATFPRATGKLLVLVHGLCMNDLQWARAGAKVGRDLGYTPVYLHYNSGRHISTNGRELAARMQELIDGWPVPVDEISILAHSMGGLVTRSACHYAETTGSGWLRRLRRIVFLATPHHGAPLERGGHWVNRLFDVSPYSAPFARLGHIRSAGITDLRHGNLLDEDWQGRDRFESGADPRRRVVPLPAGVRCYALAVTTGKRPGDLGDRLLGDGLVPVRSALGRHDDPALHLPFPPAQQWVGYGIKHLELLRSPAVHQRVRRWLAPRAERVG